MPRLDQRYGLLNGKNLTNLSLVRIVDAVDLPLQITTENVVIVNSISFGVAAITLPPITAANQGRAIFIKNRLGNGDTILLQASGTDLIQEGLLDKPFVDIGENGYRLYVARTFNDGIAPSPFNIWWEVDGPPPELNYTPVLAINANLVGPVTIKTENVVFLLGTTPLADPIVLPPITPANQGRTIYITKNFDLDPGAFRVSTTGADLLIRPDGTPVAFEDVGNHNGRLYVAQTLPAGNLAAGNYWLGVFVYGPV